MRPLTATDPETKTADLVVENLGKLKALFPEVVSEDGVNVDALKQLIGKTVSDTEEKYGLNWHGKRRARQLALTPSTGTLRPCPEDSVDWDTTRNLMIEGDNLEVLKLLQKSYAGKVKLIYIDPPYNTGGDFVYPDNFQDNIRNYLELTGQTGDGGRKLSSNTETSGRFHTDWLNMMYPRLKLARNLLREDGVIFISIDDNEVDNLRKLCDEIFGEENFVANVIWQKKYSTKADSKDFSESHEYVACYRKSEAAVILGLQRSEAQEDTYKNPDNDPRGLWASDNLLRTEEREYAIYPLKAPNGQEHWPPKGSSWRFNKEKMAELLSDNRIWFGEAGNSKPRFKRFRSDVRDAIPPQTIWGFDKVGHTDEGTKELARLFDGTRSPFPNPKPVRLLQRIVTVGCDPNGIVLDFFGGSGTSGHATWQQNLTVAGKRRFILVQLQEGLNPDDKADQATIECCDKLGKPRTIAEITKERLRRAGKKVREEWEAMQSAAAQEPELPNSESAVAKPQLPDVGFRVFKLSSSNIQAWEPVRERLAETLEASVDHLKTDRTESDVLFELLLKLGLDLTVPIEKRSIAGQDVHSIGAGTLLVCLSKTIAAKTIEALALGIVAWHKSQSPAGESTIVLRDSAFADDVAKTNLTAILEQHGLENVRSI